jgi:hypothetical protein
MSEETKVEELDLIEDVTEVQLHDDDLVEDVEVETEEAIVEDVEDLDEATEDDSVADAAKAAGATTQAAAPKTKAGLIQAMYKEMSAMDKQSLQAAYENMMGGDEEEMEEEEDEEDMKETKGKVKESYDFSADLDALVSSDETLAEGFQEKAATIFEAAVKTKVASEIDRLEEEYTTSLEEETASIKADLVEKVDGYLNYVVEGWMEENRIAVEQGLRTEIAESFMESLKSVFVEHYIDVPESKVDMVDDLAAQVVELEEHLSTSTQDNIRLNESVQAYQRSEIIAIASKDLADTEAAKLSELAEDVDFDSAETFAKKVATLKESYFAKPVTSNTEEAILSDQEEVNLSPIMAQYATALTKTLKK